MSNVKLYIVSACLWIAINANHDDEHEDEHDSEDDNDGEEAPLGLVIGGIISAVIFFVTVYCCIKKYGVRKRKEKILNRMDSQQLNAYLMEFNRNNGDSTIVQNISHEFFEELNIQANGWRWIARHLPANFARFVERKAEAKAVHQHSQKGVDTTMY